MLKPTHYLDSTFIYTGNNTAQEHFQTHLLCRQPISVQSR